tara:strand:- start:1566 stop:1799 length:234 start_codon:yes stop_codon:yes gene_type:complete
MKIYNNKNIKSLLDLIKKYNQRTMESLIWRGNKINISKDEVIKSVNLLLDLKVINEKEEMVGDGWNSIETCIFYELA